ncbi:hypothetical protein SERLA73DRAFT_80563 [Serpula lacrymans var. lacrymans S7.3]|uniref:Uncharacterized protein n=1 Tax=Serpula lacrymans var. lacrymans (strain S7.3) TaxID=936435 RepID=F8QJX7_SERL3|nr:hypothetical protein SERLA73DRAFT_80563 [Serpula lacrymans var. lacrymans S7.3]
MLSRELYIWIGEQRVYSQDYVFRGQFPLPEITTIRIPSPVIKSETPPPPQLKFDVKPRISRSARAIQQHGQRLHQGNDGLITQNRNSPPERSAIGSIRKTRSGKGSKSNMNALPITIRRGTRRSERLRKKVKEATATTSRKNGEK